MTSSASEGVFFNPSPTHGIATLGALKRAMTAAGPHGAAYLDYLLTGRYFDGKAVWVSDTAATRAAYEQLLATHPHLITESPYSPRFRRDGIRVRGENPVRLSPIRAASAQDRASLDKHRAEVRAGLARPVAAFAGGPAAKIAALLSALQGQAAPAPIFFLDGAEQSNESGSASYEHINHAHALNADFGNSGLAIALTAARRALFGERDAAAALKPGYRCIDLWPRGVTLRDVPIYLHYELHGLKHRMMNRLGRFNDHDRSRLAGKLSTRVLSVLEARAGVGLRMPAAPPRAFFLYTNQAQWRAAQRENRHLQKTLQLKVDGLSRDTLLEAYGKGVLDAICGGDLFPENNCIRHGFDGLVADALARLGGSYRARTGIREIYFAGGSAAETADPQAVGLRIEDFTTGRTSFQPLDHLGLSLGPSATYHYHPQMAGAPISRWLDGALEPRSPVPHQTIATGVTMQVLFRIVDRQRHRAFPFTGMKQTHFVEIGSNTEHVLVKLTAGGNIGLPVYSRSYAISALANLLRIVTPDSGLSFVDVVCAWPCTRGINGPNNGQIVRVADNCAIRFGEGGTGMSKMGSNAQTILDLVGIPHGLPPDATLAYRDYEHTVLDRRAHLARHLRRVEC